jgi:cyclopropane fatty-acyl-phospholipid synthase-like methyltransferase
MKIRIGSELAGVAGFFYGQAVRRIAASYSPYQPVTIRGSQLCRGERCHLDRWNMVEGCIRATGAKTLIDLGCAEGYFVERAASACGCIALGVDTDVRRLSLAQASATLNRVHGAGFMYADLTLEFIDTLPVFDGVLLMSVLHHVMYEHGVDYARDYLRRLRPKAGRFMIFEMGQSDETENEWSRLLPDMGNDPHAWIAEFLKQVGFGGVKELDSTDAYQGKTKRAVFLLTQ